MKSFSRCALIGVLLFASTTIGFGQSFDEFLDECEGSGRAAGSFGVRGACAALLNKCPPPLLAVARIIEPLESEAVSPGLPDDLLIEVIRSTCLSLFTGSCQSSAVDTVFLTNDFSDCKAVLESGPAPGAPDCPNRAAAVKIFEEEITSLCEVDRDDLPKPSPSVDTGKEVLLSAGKRTFQSSTAVDGFDDLAVDGNKDGDFFAGSCTHTGRSNNVLKTSNPWWTVDLGESFKITRVAITNRSDCCGERLKNFNILVGDVRPRITRGGLPNPACASNLSVPEGETESFDCPAEGRYVSVQIMDFSILTLCEVEVFGVEE